MGQNSKLWVICGSHMLGIRNDLAIEYPVLKEAYFSNKKKLILEEEFDQDSISLVHKYLILNPSLFFNRYCFLEKLTPEKLVQLNRFICAVGGEKLGSFAPILEFKNGSCCSIQEPHTITVSCTNGSFHIHIPREIIKNYSHSAITIEDIDPAYEASVLRFVYRYLYYVHVNNTKMISLIIKDRPYIALMASECLKLLIRSPHLPGYRDLVSHESVVTPAINIASPIASAGEIQSPKSTTTSSYNSFYKEYLFGVLVIGIIVAQSIYILRNSYPFK